MTHLPPAPSSGSNPSQPRPCVFRVVRVSGTIRKVEEEAVKRARADVLRAQREREREREREGGEVVIGSGGLGAEIG